MPRHVWSRSTRCRRGMKKGMVVLMLEVVVKTSAAHGWTRQGHCIT